MRRPYVLLFIVAIFYWLMIGFRFHVGMDWDNYLQIYQRAQHLSTRNILVDREPGFTLLNALAGSFGGFIFVNAFSGAVFCFGLFRVAKTFREPFIAITVATPLLVVAFAMSGTRQAIALGIIFYLYATWDNRRVWGRVALVVLASLFHFSAIFVLVFVAISANASIVIRMAAALLMVPIIVLIVRFAPSSMDAYTETYSGAQRLSAPGAIVQVGVIAIPAILFLFIRRRWIQVHGNSGLYRDLAIATIAAIPVIAFSSVGAYRFALYFWPVAMYVCAGLPSLIESALVRALYRLLIVVISFALLVGWLALGNNSWAWLPYQNWWLQPENIGLYRSSSSR
jgi:hypothetical protein